MTKRWYGVSKGNGNDGVSHLHPDYYVFTDDPWLLARAATIDDFMDNASWCELAKEADLEGDADYSISAVIYEGPEGETEFGAAVAILEVFPADDEYHENRRSDPYLINYMSIEEAIRPEALKLARKE